MREYDGKGRVSPLTKSRELCRVLLPCISVLRLVTFAAAAAAVAALVSMLARVAVVEKPTVSATASLHWPLDSWLYEVGQASTPLQIESRQPWWRHQWQWQRASLPSPRLQHHWGLLSGQQTSNCRQSMYLSWNFVTAGGLGLSQSSRNPPRSHH